MFTSYFSNVGKLHVNEDWISVDTVISQKLSEIDRIQNFVSCRRRLLFDLDELFSFCFKEFWFRKAEWLC